MNLRPEIESLHRDSRIALSRTTHNADIHVHALPVLHAQGRVHAHHKSIVKVRHIHVGVPLANVFADVFADGLGRRKVRQHCMSRNLVDAHNSYLFELVFADLKQKAVCGGVELTRPP